MADRRRSWGARVSRLWFEWKREQLLSMSRSRSLPHSLVRRANIVLMAADGHTNQKIAMQCDVTSSAITYWKKRFVANGLAGLHDKARPGQPRAHDDEAVAELLARVLHEKPNGAKHCSVRFAAAQTGILKSLVAGICRCSVCSPIVQKASSCLMIRTLSRRCAILSGCT